MADFLDGGWLDDRLAEVGSNRAKLSSALGKHRSAVTNLVNGKRQIKLTEVGLIAAHLKCSPEAIMRWAGMSGPMERQEGLGEMKQSTFEIDQHSSGPAKPSAPKTRHPAFGALKGMITLRPDVDYTQPADPDWGKVYED